VTDLLVTNGTVVTQNADREVIADGAVAVEDGRITAVGPADRLEAETDPDRVVDADGGAVIPGLIDAHVHVSDVLIRGAYSPDRGLYDWLFNVKQPAVFAMDADEHAVAARLYCVEALQAGVTTFVENATALDWRDLGPTERKLTVYDDLGLRAVYGAGIRDLPADDEFRRQFREITARGPDSHHPGPDHLVVDTDDALADTEHLIETHHDPDGRLSVWPAPATLATTTPEALRGAYRLAETHDVMTTAHVAEAEAEAAARGALSSVEYLRNVGYLGERALLGHCVQTDARDVRLLAASGTNVVHNFRANMRLATGFAPVAEMLDAGVPVSIGTDNANLNDTINPLSDAGDVATAHKGYHRDPGVVSPQRAFDMITCEAARTIGRGDELGSLVVGKRADLAVVDMAHPHLTPAPDPVHALVYGATGGEIETVVCDGEVVLEDRAVVGLDDPLPELLETAAETARSVLERSGVA
jgi:atrazine chlorohydrolase/5-methylthioadenosine/S-adenosylhomocysteine deaminase